MKTKVLGRLKAREDLLEIYIVIGLDNASAAERMLATLEDRGAAARKDAAIGRSTA